MDFDLLNALGHLERANGVVAMPGDGGYALCCRIDHPEAMARIGRMKGLQEPMLLLGRDIDAFRPYLQPVSLQAEALMRQHWPGPLILYLGKRETLPESITTRGHVAVMQPSSSRVLDLLSLTPGGLLAATGASRNDEPPAKTACDVFNTFGDDVDYVLGDDEAVRDALPATIARVDAHGAVQVLRSGAIVLD
jgi:tRNA threonylcarbamoyl adenosine modification protein (Sua5/YciO/YrdC/YwlC family)